MMTKRRDRVATTDDASAALQVATEGLTFRCTDGDGDGMPDGWEYDPDRDPQYWADPLVDDAAADPDKDGLSNLGEYLNGTDPLNPDTDGDGVSDGEEVSAGEDPLHIEYCGPRLPSSADPEAYCTIDLAAAEPLTFVAFAEDGPSDLADPCFHIFSNETVRVTILIGKTFAITSSAPIVCTGKSDYKTVVSNVSATALSVVRPVTFSYVPGNAAGAFRISVTPSWLDGVFSFGTNACCSVEETGSRTFRFACAADCPCGGCAIDSFFTYEGYSLFYRIASCCCTPPPKETLTFALDRGTAFANDDDDDGDGTVDSLHPFAADDDVVTGRIEFRSGTPVAGTIRVSDRDGFGGGIFSDFGMTDETDSWELSGDTSFTKTLYFNPDFFSAGRAGSRIAVRWEPSSGSDGLTATDRLVVTEPVVEPVCPDQTNVTVDGVAHTYTVNPCGIVVGRNAYFRIGLEPADFPDDEIVWEAVGSGRIAFMGGNRGRSVCVRGVRSGETELQVRIGDCGSEIPRFPVRVVTNSVVKLSAWIVENKKIGSPRTVDEVRELIRQVNDIYAQVGVSFDIGDRIAITNIPQAYNILWEGTTNTMWNFGQLVDTHTDTGGLELYFVNDIVKAQSNNNRNAIIIGGHNGYGIVISKKGTAVTVAHEVGHAFGMRDIYIEQNSKGIGFDEYVSETKVICDWSGGCVGRNACGARYYDFARRQRDIIRAMLMDGRKIDAAKGCDITYGPVYGVDVDGDKDSVMTGFFLNPDHCPNPAHR